MWVFITNTHSRSFPGGCDSETKKSEYMRLASPIIRQVREKKMKKIRRSIKVLSKSCEFQK